MFGRVGGTSCRGRSASIGGGSWQESRTGKPLWNTVRTARFSCRETPGFRVVSQRGEGGVGGAGLGGGVSLGGGVEGMVRWRGGGGELGGGGEGGGVGWVFLGGNL